MVGKFFSTWTFGALRYFDVTQTLKNVGVFFEQEF